MASLSKSYEPGHVEEQFYISYYQTTYENGLCAFSFKGFANISSISTSVPRYYEDSATLEVTNSKDSHL
ncbi:hypothetical protein AAEX28_12910 [Lentisphaerota bacterium WC36G]|nr:hypothetical protein LJT99_15730 [Lentisphaerae bacterium WC36]